MIADLIAAIEKHNALMLRGQALIADGMEKIAASWTDGPPIAPAVLAIGRVFKSCFWAGDVWAEAERQAKEAEDSGAVLPDLPRAMAEAEIRSARALGTFLSRQVGRGIIRVDDDRNGVIWQCDSATTAAILSNSLTR